MYRVQYTAGWDGDEVDEWGPERPSRQYFWFKKHRKHMVELSRRYGAPEPCMTHRDGRCTRGWDEGLTPNEILHRYLQRHPASCDVKRHYDSLNVTAMLSSKRDGLTSEMKRYYTDALLADSKTAFGRYLNDTLMRDIPPGPPRSMEWRRSTNLPQSSAASEQEESSVSSSPTYAGDSSET